MRPECRERLHAILGAEFELEKHRIERLLRERLESAEGIGSCTLGGEERQIFLVSAPPAKPSRPSRHLLVTRHVYARSPTSTLCPGSSQAD